MKLAKLLEQNDAWQEKTRKEEEARQQWFNRKGAADIVIEILRRLEIRIQADFRDEFMIAPNGKKYYFGQDPKFLALAYKHNGYRNVLPYIEPHPEVFELAKYVLPKLGINVKNWQKYAHVHPGKGPFYAEGDFRKEKLLRGLGFSKSNTTLQKFIQMLDGFDWTYEMSDDSRVWSAGSSAMSEFRDMFKDLPKEDKMKAFEYWKSKASKKFGRDMQQFIPPSKDYAGFAKWFGEKETMKEDLSATGSVHVSNIKRLYRKQLDDIKLDLHSRYGSAWYDNQKAQEEFDKRARNIIQLYIKTRRATIQPNEIEDIIYALEH